MRRATDEAVYAFAAIRISIHALLAESDYWAQNAVLAWAEFLSTLSLRRATKQAPEAVQHGAISIHALLAESDSRVKFAKHLQTEFYPRSPCGERQSPQSWRKPHGQFLSTLSLRRATSGRPDNRRSCAISIHALLAESDREKPRQTRTDTNFYPRSPCGERLNGCNPDLDGKLISIHALLAESDVTRVARTPTTVISIHALLAESDPPRTF